MSKLERLTRHALLFHEGCLRQMVRIGMKLPMFFNMLLKVRVVEFLHHTFFKKKMLLKQAEEFDNFRFGTQSIVIWSHHALLLKCSRRCACAGDLSPVFQASTRPSIPDLSFALCEGATDRRFLSRIASFRTALYCQFEYRFCAFVPAIP